LGILDTVGGLIGGGLPTPGLVPQVISLLTDGSAGGLAGLAERFKAAGLGEVVESWIGTGHNLPISPSQLTTVLGRSKLTEMAAGAGVPFEHAAGQISELLPGLVNALTPGGTIPPETDVPSQIAALWESSAPKT